MRTAGKRRSAYLFVLPWSLASPGGVNQVVENLIRQMELDGRYIPLLMVNSWADVRVREEKINDRTHLFFRLRPPWDKRWPLKAFFAFCVTWVIESFKLMRFLNYNNVAVVNVHYCGLHALNLGILRRLGLFRGKFILSFHGMDLLAAQDARGFERYLWKALLRWADTIVMCSEALRKNLHKYNIYYGEKDVVIHNGIDVKELEGNQNSVCDVDLPAEGRKIVLNIATFEYKKGQDILLRAFVKVSKEVADVDLVLVGRPAESLNEVKRLIISLGLEDRVRLYEGLPHNKIPALLNRATVFALPTRHEPFGIVILEAGVFGLPVVATNVGGIPEILTHNETGRLCKPDDIEGLRESYFTCSGTRKKESDWVTIFAGTLWKTFLGHEPIKATSGVFRCKLTDGCR